MKPNQWIACGALLAGLAVVTGAFGAHGLEQHLTQGRPRTELTKEERDELDKRFANYETAAHYQMYHALALVLVGLTGTWRRTQRLNAAGWAFLAGMTSFSGGVYAMVFGAPTWLGARVVPLGGLVLIVGWLIFAAAAWTAGAAGERSPP